MLEQEHSAEMRTTGYRISTGQLSDTSLPEFVLNLRPGELPPIISQHPGGQFDAVFLLAAYAVVSDSPSEVAAASHAACVEYSTQPWELHDPSVFCCSRPANTTRYPCYSCIGSALYRG